MSIRTTVTLDEDVMARVRNQSKTRGKPFRQTLNELLREALVISGSSVPRRTIKIDPSAMGPREGLNYDDVEGLLEYAEGEKHR